MPAFNPRYLPWGHVCAFRPPASEPPEVFPGIYACGSLDGLRRPTVAVVGTRAASTAGKDLARRVSEALSRAGATIISGLANGIDAAAHQGAIDGGGVTIGVLGGGHEHFFPPRNRALAERMIESGGAVCSPFAPGEAAFPYKFLQRNGVVAALSDAVVVIEAPARSGALNTAQWAAGRIPVFVFPGDVDRRNVAGCLALIRDGATLVRDAADILGDMRIDTAPAMQARLELLAAENPRNGALLKALALHEATADQLACATGYSAPEILAALTELELGGAVVRRDGGAFARSPAV